MISISRDDSSHAGMKARARAGSVPFQIFLKFLKETKKAKMAAMMKRSATVSAARVAVRSQVILNSFKGWHRVGIGCILILGVGEQLNPEHVFTVDRGYSGPSWLAG